MKNLKRLLLSLGIVYVNMFMYAQQPLVESGEKEPEQMRREIFTPEQVAKHETDRLKEVLELSEKQYKKVYKLLLKEQRALLENRMPHSPMGMDNPMFMDDDFERNDFRPPHQMTPPSDRLPFDKENAEEMQKRIKKKNKKMKKILTESQYDKWLSMDHHPVRPFKEPVKEENSASEHDNEF